MARKHLFVIRATDDDEDGDIISVQFVTDQDPEEVVNHMASQVISLFIEKAGIPPEEVAVGVFPYNSTVDDDHGPKPLGDQSEFLL